MIKERIIEDILKLWGLQLLQIREDIPIAGSPDRCLFRTVIEDRERKFYILENLAPENVPHKKKIAQTLIFLSKKGLLFIHPYFPIKLDEYIVLRQNRHWQLSPYIEGVPLMRPDYAFEKWRGEVLAGFLIDLWEKSEDLPFFSRSQPFSICSFIREFLVKIKSREPDLYNRVHPAVAFLEQDFMTAHENFPVRFGHGDFHPLNVIWSAEGIKAVIDWEFLGYKPELYDVAMMIGCLGMEKPQSLTGDLVFEFLKHLKESKLFTATSWSFLFEYVLALRFAWLSNWLKLSDFEMIDLEAVYIQLLLDNREIFIRSWRIE